MLIYHIYEDMMFCFNEIICTEEDLILSLPEENEFQHIVIDSKYISESQLNVLAIDKHFKRSKSPITPQRELSYYELFTSICLLAFIIFISVRLCMVY